MQPFSIKQCPKFQRTPEMKQFVCYMNVVVQLLFRMTCSRKVLSRIKSSFTFAETISLDIILLLSNLFKTMGLSSGPFSAGKFKAILSLLYFKNSTTINNMMHIIFFSNYSRAYIHEMVSSNKLTLLSIMQEFISQCQ